jgi:hypothetical protein
MPDRGLTTMEKLSDREMVRAVVSDGAIETHYRRAGIGPAVVVLGFSFEDDTSRVPVPLQPLVDCCRVIVPDHASIAVLAPASGCASTPFTGWLRGFLEGLGIHGTRVVAAAALDTALASFLAEHPGEIDRVLIIGANSGVALDAPTFERTGVTVWRTRADISWEIVAWFVAVPSPMHEAFMGS